MFDSRRTFVCSLVLTLAIGAGLGCKGDTGTEGLTGAAGKSALVSLVPEAAGAHCASGGVAVETGLDANGNGTLEASEIDASKTQYVCNGSQPTGTVSRVETETAGPNCAQGGLAVESGVDANHDGVLQDSEVNASLTQYVCNGVSPDSKVHYGDVQVNTAADLTQLDGIEVVVGNVSIDDSIEGEVNLGSVRVITGGLGVFSGDGSIGLGPLLRVGSSSALVGPSGLAEVSAPALTSVGQLFVLSTTVQTISLPVLSQLGLAQIQANLTALDLSDLAIGSLAIDDTQLTSIELPSLTNGSVDVRDNPALTGISLPKLTSGRFYLESNAALSTVSAPLFAQGSAEVHQSNALTQLTLPAFLSGTLVVNDNSALTSLALPAMTAGSVDIERDGALSDLTSPPLGLGANLHLDGDAALGVLTLTGFNGAALRINNSSVTSIELPDATGSESLDLQDDSALTSISAPKLVALGLNATGDDSLQTLDTPMLISLSGNVHDNGPSAICAVEQAEAAVLRAGGSNGMTAVGDDSACDLNQVCTYVTVNGDAQTYRQCLNHLDWASSQLACQSMGTTGSDLLTLGSASEYSAVATLLQQNRFAGGSFIGYDNIGQADNSNYVWVNGSTGFTPQAGDLAPFWAPGEPSDSGGGEHCAQLYVDGTANDTDCSAPQTFICQVVGANNLP